MFNKIYESIKKFLSLNYKFLIFLILIIFVFTFELPYVVYTPGGVVPLEKRIEIENSEDKTGSLNMSYVLLRKGTIPAILTSFIISNWDLVSDREITNDDENIDELLEKEKLYMTSSLDNATILAYKKANKEINITKTINNVIYIDEASKTNIKMFDQIIKVDGKDIKDINELKKIVNEHKKGDLLNVEVLRNGKHKFCEAEVFEINGNLKIGIAFLTTYEYETDPKIKIKTKNSESGSSGGLMLSLAIYNSLVSEDITNNRKIVGTGTIDINGNVGEIDGVKYKMLGAKKNKADVFLCPYENYEEAINVKNKYDIDMEVIGVKTFDEALAYLKK